MSNLSNWQKSTTSSIALIPATSDPANSRTTTFNHPGGLAAFAFACLIGTGGMTTSAYINHQQARGYHFSDITPSAKFARINLLPDAKKNLAHVRSVLKPSVSELAAILGVTRQTLYNWMAGERPTSESAERLDELARAVDLFIAHGLSNSAYLFRRKLIDGKSFAEVTREGGNAIFAAEKMVAIAHKEAAQRKTMQIRIASRPGAAKLMHDLGIPKLDEET